jgi:hypothetical protein
VVLPKSIMLFSHMVVIETSWNEQSRTSTIFKTANVSVPLLLKPYSTLSRAYKHDFMGHTLPASRAHGMRREQQLQSALLDLGF